MSHMISILVEYTRYKIVVYDNKLMSFVLLYTEVLYTRISMYMVIIVNAAYIPITTR